MFKPLRDKILELAITGKLVPQLDSEPAVEQIGPAPAKDEEPFALPEKWKWVRFKFTVDCLDYKRVPVKQADRDKQAKIYDYYGATGVIDKVADFIFDGRFLLIGEDGANLISKVKNNAFIANGKYWVNNHAHVFADNGVASLDYLAHFINAISLEPYLTYSAQPKLTQGKLLSIFVPLPPLEEQRRIVAKLDDIMGNLERMDQAYTELSGPMLKHFKNLVLQQAISGQLVPQMDSEPAVEQIGPAPVKEEEPFALPEKWKWVQLENLCLYLQRGKSPKYSEIKKYPVVAQKCNQWDGLHLELALFFDPNTLASYKAERFLQQDDVLLNSTGTGTLGRVGSYDVAVNPYELAVADGHVTVIRANSSCLTDIEHLLLIN